MSCSWSALRVGRFDCGDSATGYLGFDLENMRPLLEAQNTDEFEFPLAQPRGGVMTHINSEVQHATDASNGDD